MTAIARELVAAVARLAERGPLPRVKALHLPPPEADGTRPGEFCALELEGGALGLSFLLLADTAARLRAAAPVAGADSLEVARWFAERRGFAIVGPGAGCLPDPLFARGVTLVGGTWAVDRPAFVEAIRSGHPWRDAARKFAVAREGYPGVEVLLRRIPPAPGV